MSKPRHKPRKSPSPSRMTDEQLRRFITGMIESSIRTALDQGREPAAVTFNEADELPGGKLETVCPSCGNGARVTPCPVCNPKIDRAKPISDEAQTGAAPTSTVSPA